MERTYGFELEFADADRSMIDLPNGYKYTDNEIGRMHNSDGSKVSHKGMYGGEINTRPLKYTKDDIKELDNFIQSIKSAGGYLIWNEGFDAHMYAKDLELDVIKRIFELSYWVAPYLKEIFDLAPWFENKYVSPSPTYDYVEKMNSITDIKQVSNVFSNASKRGHIRFYLNIVPINTIGTVEFRLFNSSWDFTKTLETIKFMYRFIGYARTHTVEDFKGLDSVEKCLEVFRIKIDRIPQKQSPLLWASAHDNFKTLVEDIAAKSNIVMRKIRHIASSHDKAIIVNSYYGDIEQAIDCSEIVIYEKHLFMITFWKIICDDIVFSLGEEYAWIEIEKGDKAERLAKLMLFNKIRVTRTNNASLKAYHEAIFNDYRANLKSYIEKYRKQAAEILSRLEGKTISIVNGDISQAISESDGSLLIYQSEFNNKFKAASNGLAKYTEFESNTWKSDYKDIDLNGMDYIVLSKNKHLDLERHFRSKRDYIYSNTSLLKRSVFKDKKLEPLRYQLMPRHYDIKSDANIVFKAALMKEVDYLRVKYMKADVMLGVSPYNYLWFVDGFLIGATMFDYLKAGDPSSIYMKSDFVIDTEVFRLSKLLIMSVLTEDFKVELSKRFRNSVNNISTTIFTDKPVSMKYRGVFKKTKKEPGKLTYEQRAGSMTNEQVITKYIKSKK